MTAQRVPTTTSHAADAIDIRVARLRVAHLLVELVCARADTRSYLYHHDLIRLAEQAMSNTKKRTVFAVAAIKGGYVSEGHYVADQMRKAYEDAGHRLSSYDAFSGIMYDLSPLVDTIRTWGSGA